MTRAIRLTSTILAILCGLAFIPWTLGIPGVENDYARGWMIGYQAIIFYTLTIIVLALVQMAAHFAKWPAVPRWLDIVRGVAMIGFVLAQAVAWPLILR